MITLSVHYLMSFSNFIGIKKKILSEIFIQCITGSLINIRMQYPIPAAILGCNIQYNYLHSIHIVTTRQWCISKTYCMGQVSIH